MGGGYGGVVGRLWGELWGGYGGLWALWEGYGRLWGGYGGYGGVVGSRFGGGPVGGPIHVPGPGLPLPVMFLASPPPLSLLPHPVILLPWQRRGRGWSPTGGPQRFPPHPPGLCVPPRGGDGFRGSCPPPLPPPSPPCYCHIPAARDRTGSVAPATRPRHHRDGWMRGGHPLIPPLVPLCHCLCHSVTQHPHRASVATLPFPVHPSPSQCPSAAPRQRAGCPPITQGWLLFVSPQLWGGSRWV